MKWLLFYFITVSLVLFKFVLGDYNRQYNNGYPLVRSNGNGYTNGIDYGYNNGYGYPQDYNSGVNNGHYNDYYNRPSNNYKHQDSRFYQDPYAQPLWPKSAPLPYQEFPKSGGEKFYDNLASRKHDRSLLENLNNFPVAKH